MNDADDHELKYRALSMWANWIETGNVVLSAGDVAQIVPSERRQHRAELKVLSPDQVQFVARLRALANEELNYSHVKTRDRKPPW